MPQDGGEEGAEVSHTGGRPRDRRFGKLSLHVDRKFGSYPRYTSRIYMHCLLIFQEVMPISKTRNQLTDKAQALKHQ
jgi:hypothetical protein